MIYSTMLMVYRLSWLMSVGMVVSYSLFVQIANNEPEVGEGKRETQGVRFPKSIPPSRNLLEHGGHMNSRYQ